jgi:hypothetical protein
MVVTDRPYTPGVYVMAAPTHPEWGVKLGCTVTSSVTARARAVAGALPVDVVVLAFAEMGRFITWPDTGQVAYDCEAWLHDLFAARRWRGEWFRMEPVEPGTWGPWLAELVRRFESARWVEAITAIPPEDMAEAMDADENVRAAIEDLADRLQEQLILRAGEVDPPLPSTVAI